MPRQSKYIPLIFLSMCLGGKGMSDTLSTVGIVEGFQEKGRSHVALASAGGTLTKLTGGSFETKKEGETLAVRISRSGIGVVGGIKEGDHPYVALFGPNGATTPLMGSALLQEGSGAIYSVTINNREDGIIGRDPYAALIDTDGTATALRGGAFPKTKERIQSVAIHNSGIPLLGGVQEGNKGYVGLVAPDGTTTSLQFARTNSTEKLIPESLNSVAINSSGNRIIEGKHNNKAFDALVRNDRTVVPLSEDGAPQDKGEIYSVAINNSGIGLIGGAHSNAKLYAGLVRDGRTFVPLSGGEALQGEGTITSVAINDSGVGLIGGTHRSAELYSGLVYAGLVKDGGTVIPLSGDGAPQGIGQINSVAINDSGIGLIGGIHRSFEKEPYAGLVRNGGIVVPLSGDGAPQGRGTIYSVAINDSGVGLIGGMHRSAESYFGLVYAGLVKDGRTVVPLSGDGAPQGKGTIYSVAINDSRVGLIGGTHRSAELYAGLVRNGGIVVPLSGDGAPQGRGRIYSVAINDSGVGLISGYLSETGAYAAIIAPDGTATSLWNTILEAREVSREVSAARLSRSNPILDGINPESFGEGTAFADPLFALSKGAFKAHLNGLSFSQEDSTSLALVADASDSAWNFNKKEKDSFWLAPFMFQASHKGKKDFSFLKSRGGGVLLGVDYSRVGLALAYAYQAAHGAEDRRWAYTYQELATVYGSWEGRCVFIEGALWGGFSQMRNHRLTLGFIPSKALVKGRLLSPHVKVGTCFGGEEFSIRPFIEFDWANIWQGFLKERGKSGLNLEMNPCHLSVIRSEFGCEFVQKKRRGKGCMAFRQGISYVNRSSPRKKMVEAHYALAVSTFPITLSLREIHHLCALFLSGSFSSKNTRFPIASFGYQGEFGAKMTFHALSIELRKHF